MYMRFDRVALIIGVVLVLVALYFNQVTLRGVSTQEIQKPEKVDFIIRDPQQLKLDALVKTQIWGVKYVPALDTMKLGQKGKMLIIMYSDKVQEYELYTRQLNKLYAKKHGFDTYVAPNNVYSDIAPWWRKIFILNNAMDKSGDAYDYVMWLDSDAAFVKNFHISLAEVFNGQNRAIHLASDSNFLLVNAGVMAIKTDAVGRDYLKTLINIYDPNNWSNKKGCEDNYIYKFHDWCTNSIWAAENFEQSQMNELLESRFGSQTVIYDKEFFSCDFETPRCQPVFIRHTYYEPNFPSEMRTKIFKKYLYEQQKIMDDKIMDE